MNNVIINKGLFYIMCFSAQASFVAATTLATIGVLSLLKARTFGFRLLALSPLFLGVQQALEGLVWLRINSGDMTSLWFKIGVYGFEFFAAAFWPLWIPFVLYVLEQRTQHKQILGILSCMGFVMYAIALLALWKSPAAAQTIDHHMHYPFLVTPLRWLVPSLSNWYMDMVRYTILAVYVILTIGSCFVSTLPGVRIIGILFTIGYIAAMLGYKLTFASTWCFFAAIASASVYGIIMYHNRYHKARSRS